MKGGLKHEYYIHKRILNLWTTSKWLKIDPTSSPLFLQKLGEEIKSMEYGNNNM